MKTIEYLLKRKMPVIVLVCAMLVTGCFSSLSFAESDTNETPEIPENIEVNDAVELNAEGEQSDSTTSDPAVNDSATNDPAANEPVASDPEAIEIVQARPITAEEIQKYGYYKGKNATRIPILTYHQIVSDKEKKTKKYRKDKWTISQSKFNKQMKWLHKKHYRTINCDEFYLWYMGKIKLPKRSVLITIDDGKSSAIERALPVFRKYNMKGTAFIIGHSVHNWNSSLYISEDRVREIQKTYPKLEFQSHTYSLHYKAALNSSYEVFMKDAKLQRDAFGFDYLAYPYGRKSNTMIKAYKDSGIRMAFSFADYGFATKKQHPFKIKRLAVLGSTSMRKFRRWCK